MKKDTLFKVLIGGTFAFLFIIVLLDKYNIKEPILIRKAIDAKEPMIDYLSPANIDTSYSLLNGVLDLKDQQVQGTLTSQSCYNSDYEVKLENVGNFNQRTNNYIHKDAESCSAPLHEFVGSYYKVNEVN